MSEPFIGQINVVAFNFAPRGWAECNGQLLPIAQNTALFSLLGTTFGGDGRSTFALPDLRGRTPVHWGQGPGLPEISLGESAGSETVTLISTQMPMHNHIALASASPGNQPGPAGHSWAAEGTGATFVYSNQSPNGSMGPTALASAGGNQPHNNMQPYLTMNFVIALVGIFPSRN